MSAREEILRFECFGGSCLVLVVGDRAAAERARDTLLGWHERFSRFLATSEISRLNRDPRATVPVSGVMAQLALAVRQAGEMTAGLVDGTLLGELERLGYTHDLAPAPPLPDVLALAPPRRAAARGPHQLWRRIEANQRAGTVTRPPSVSIDGGGLAKGLFADLLATELADHAAFAIGCAGDLTVGGSAAPERELKVESPFDGSTLHSFRVTRAAAATSGIGRRCWIGEDGIPRHHLLDPASGRPAFTGIVQTSALAPSALEAEIRAKAALLSGPAGAPAWLRHGGVVVYDDGRHELFEPPPTIAARRRAGSLVLS
ncbi:MAG TPA: FAD:protein FMN transferase [Solirubrobacteraceae bacterium]|jgi:thiamine biosynthesis lipoprotein